MKSNTVNIPVGLLIGHDIYEQIKSGFDIITVDYKSTVHFGKKLLKAATGMNIEVEDCHSPAEFMDMCEWVRNILSRYTDDSFIYTAYDQALCEDALDDYWYVLEQFGVKFARVNSLPPRVLQALDLWEEEVYEDDYEAYE